MDARSHDPLLQPEYTSASGERPSIGIADVLGALRRGWRLPLLGLLIGLMVGTSYVVIVKAPYKSSARILLDRSVNRYLQTNKISDEPIFDEMEIGSQVYVLSSDSVIVPVVKSLNLARDAEFVSSSDARGGLVSIGALTTLVAKSLGWSADASSDVDTARERTAVEALLKHLTITREDVANVISINLESRDSDKAAKIANAIADTYIAITQEEKLKSTKTVSRWLQDRLTELKAQAAEADRALQEYKIANNLINSGKTLLNNEQLVALNAQLSSARTAVVEAKERLDRIQQLAGEGVSTVVGTDALLNSARSGVINYALNNSDLVRLRSQYRDLAARVAEMEARVGPGHSAVLKLRKQIDMLRAAIQVEEQRIGDSYVNEYRVAKARESELAARTAQLVEETETGSHAQVTMRELESSAETLRSLYAGFLQKFKEINTIQTEAIPVHNARIITRAVPPLYKSSKKSIAVFAGSLMLCFFLGVGAALGREWMADVLRTPKAVEQVTGQVCTILPMVRPGSPRGGRQPTIIEEVVLDSPYSRFTETFRDIKSWINSGQHLQRPKVIGVVSSVPKEGKTVVSANLAALLVTSGARTLVIDGDLHLRKLTATLAPDAREGLIEALEDPSRLPDLVCKRQRSGLDVLPCVFPIRIPNAAELLASREMELLLAAARQSYDYVIIEIAPVMSVVDVKMIERFIDGFIFVIEWGQTKRALVLDALSNASVIGDRIIGMVLNKADPAELRSIESYKGQRFADYYQD